MEISNILVTQGSCSLKLITFDGVHHDLLLLLLPSHMLSTAFIYPYFIFTFFHRHFTGILITLTQILATTHTEVSA